MITGLSLYKIETELVQLIDAREQAESEGELPETLAVIDQQIQAYFLAEVRKVDGIASYIHHGKEQRAAAKVEAQRITDWDRRWERRLERVKAATIYAMGAAGVRKLESAVNRLRLQKNPASVDVYDVAALPDEFLVVQVSMPMAYWKQLNVPPSIVSSITSTVDKRAVGVALKNRVECSDCRGMGARLADNAMQLCPRCEGNKTIPATVPGARWAPETEHLRCE